jgi:phosphonate metabolism-associated iron-containing alcohol dehydrogenase
MEENAMWTFYNPVRIRFGDGQFSSAATAIRKRRYLVVSYPDAFAHELVERLAAEAGPAVSIIDDVVPNPDLPRLAEQARRMDALAQPPEVIVAIGGGSVIDTAKVLAAARGEFGALVERLLNGVREPETQLIPLIAVPTTAGTGSEVTPWATVWDTQASRKYSLSAPGLFPELAVVDPKLMSGKPQRLTIATGLDALSHSFESVWNCNANPTSLLYARHAIREIVACLPELACNGERQDLRSRMALAALFAGLAFSNTRTSIAHSISYAITLEKGIEHGIACSFTLPVILRSFENTSDPVHAALTSIFDETPQATASRIDILCERLGVSTDPQSYGLTRSELLSIVSNAFEGERGQNYTGDKSQLLAGFGATVAV